MSLLIIINNTLEISKMLNLSYNCEYNPVNYSVLADTFKLSFTIY